MLHSLNFHVFAHAFKLKRLYIYHTVTSVGSSEFRRSFRHHSGCQISFGWCGMRQVSQLAARHHETEFWLELWEIEVFRGHHH